MNQSLRLRLLIGIAVTTFVGFAITVVVIYVSMRATLLTEFDQLLAGKARALATLVEQEGDDIVVKFAEYPMQEFARKIRPEYFQLWDEDHSVLARSRRLESHNLARVHGSLAAPGSQFATLADGRPGRLVGLQFLPAVKGESLISKPGSRIDDAEDARDQVTFAGRRRVTLVVGKETAEIDRSIGRVAWTLTAVSAIAICGMLVVLSCVVTCSLRPLDELAAQIAAVDERGLSEHVHVARSPRELTPVIARLNELFDRLEDAFQRERVFTANVAHELRTPLAGLRTMLEVNLRRSRKAAEYRRVLEDCQEICQDTHGLIETLLSLARIDSGREVVERSLVNLADCLSSTWSALSVRARQRDLQMRCDGPTNVFLYTDAGMFRVVLANLWDNAVEYSDPAGDVECRWLVGPAGLSLTVTNANASISEEQCLKVFDRFWRADQARAATGLHAGLGLSLCQKILETLGGSIDATRCAGRFVIRISFGTEFVEQVEDEFARSSASHTTC